MAAEAYNGARYELNQLTLRIQENTRRAGVTARDLRTSRATLGQRLRNLYATPDPTLIEVLVASGSVAGASEYVDLLDRVGQRDAGVVGENSGTRRRDLPSSASRWTKIV